MKALAIIALVAASVWLDNNEPTTVNLTAPMCAQPGAGCYP